MNERSIDNSLEWYIGDKYASVTASEMKLKNKIKKLAKDYPDDVKILYQNEDGSILARMPRNWIKINKPRKGGAGNPNGGEALKKWREEKKRQSELNNEIENAEEDEGDEEDEYGEDNE